MYRKSKIHRTINWTENNVQTKKELICLRLNASHYILHRKRSLNDCSRYAMCTMEYTQCVCDQSSRQMCERMHEVRRQNQRSLIIRY